MSSDLRKALQTAWVHSHEEDDGGRVVFRSPNTELPPARGRTAFTLKSGGAVEVVGPGPDDRRKASSGHWTLEGKRLRIDAPGLSGTFDVETVDDQHLVVRRVEEEK